jgi:hypothetical protein
MAGFKYEIGATVRLNDRRGTVAKVIDRLEMEPRVYVLETADQRKYEMVEDDIAGLA